MTGWVWVVPAVAGVNVALAAILGPALRRARRSMPVADEVDR
jgi:hypothetical protein